MYCAKLINVSLTNSHTNVMLDNFTIQTLHNPKISVCVRNVGDEFRFTMNVDDDSVNQICWNSNLETDKRLQGQCSEVRHLVKTIKRGVTSKTLPKRLKRYNRYLRDLNLVDGILVYKKLPL